MPEFWNVERMPEATPRCRAGTLLMMAEVLGEANSPEPMPLNVDDQGERPVREVHREQHQADERRRRHQQAGGRERRGPYRSDRYPDTGPASRNPAVSGSM